MDGRSQVNSCNAKSLKNVLIVNFRQVGEAEAEEGQSEDEYEDEGWQTDEQIYETVRIEQRKKESTSSQVSSGPSSLILSYHGMCAGELGPGPG